MNRLLWNLWPWMLSVIFAIGCTQSEFQPLKGKVVLDDAADFSFDQDVVELRLKSNHDQLAFGAIQADGSFEVQSLNQGEIVNGARPGTYEVRIVIADDDYSHKKLASQRVSKRYLHFESSGLSVDVPDNDVVFELVR